ncbi:MAG: peptidase [Alteromonadaceae bacterium]|nr:peptidase [Alteromonadaceae bacterium]
MFRPAPLALTVTALLTAGCANHPWSTKDHQPATKDSVVDHYADLAHANYEDALITARALDEATDRLIANPTEANLATAKEAWLAARVPYQQTEVFRFGNAIVDDWEGQLNAWPLDEGLIDYVKADGYQHELGNAGATANIIASNRINVGGETLNVASLSPALLADLNEVGGSEANVATGYHAVEFLLWGQDLHGFESGASDNYRAQLTAADANQGVQKMLFGMGSLSLGELAGERMKVALEANSYEDEHDCFSDNTHNSHYYNGQGIQNVYTGTYRRVDGSLVTGPSLSDLVQQSDPELDARLNNQLDASMEALALMKARAESNENPMAFDTMIAPGNAEGTRIVNGAIMALVAQTGSIEQAARDLGIEALSPDDAGQAF